MISWIQVTKKINSHSSTFWLDLEIRNEILTSVILSYLYYSLNPTLFTTKTIVTVKRKLPEITITITITITIVIVIIWILILLTLIILLLILILTVIAKRTIIRW